MNAKIHQGPDAKVQRIAQNLDHAIKTPEAPVQARYPAFWLVAARAKHNFRQLGSVCNDACIATAEYNRVLYDSAGTRKKLLVDDRGTP